jgi:hypothetical protein
MESPSCLLLGMPGNIGPPGEKMGSEGIPSIQDGDIQPLKGRLKGKRMRKFDRIFDMK